MFHPFLICDTTLFFLFYCLQLNLFQESSIKKLHSTTQQFWRELFICSSQTFNMSTLNNSGEESSECPLCMEPLDLDDLSFYPCTCGYQVRNMSFPVLLLEVKSRPLIALNLAKEMEKHPFSFNFVCLSDMPFLLASHKDGWERVVPCMSQGIPGESGWFQASLDAGDTSNQSWEEAERPAEEAEGYWEQETSSQCSSCSKKPGVRGGTFASACRPRGKHPSPAQPQSIKPPHTRLFILWFFVGPETARVLRETRQDSQGSHQP